MSTARTHVREGETDLQGVLQCRPCTTALLSSPRTDPHNRQNEDRK
jgi:hypothetical protein